MGSPPDAIEWIRAVASGGSSSDDGPDPSDADAGGVPIPDLSGFPRRDGRLSGPVPPPFVAWRCRTPELSGGPGTCLPAVAAFPPCPVGAGTKRFGGAAYRYGPVRFPPHAFDRFDQIRVATLC
ncbi:hypothetical protein Psuf_068060 [Phytohabitans suffuscus]|uniref:Uncharacterized protein n=1 Tax=Phytohabitans suffuscus TaxID=624315 RepID=A0A6F8YU40_9ACTN|nr:hypothetical protein Psuf_068060 [Phytohabitans suffuscus]